MMPLSLAPVRRCLSSGALLVLLSAGGSLARADDAPVVRVEINGHVYAGRLQRVPPTPPTTPPVTPPATPDAPIALAAGVAPLGVHLDAADAIDPGRLRDTRVTWDFGDPGSAFDVIDGYNAAHVYDAPGAYAITRTVATPAGTATRRYRVEVRPDARRTVYASMDGDDRNDGRSPERPVRSFAFATAGLAAGGNAQVLFRRGDAFAAAGGLAIRGDDVRLGAYGDPAKPRPVLATAAAAGGATLFTVSGARFVAEDLAFDAPDAPPFEKAGTAIVFRAPGAAGMVIRRCTFLNVGSGIDGNGRPAGVLMQGNDVPLASGLRGYLAWVEGTNWTFLGNRAANSTREHIVRVGGAERVNVQFNDFANLDRRAAQPHPDANDTAKAAVNVQKGAVAYVAHNVLTGPSSVGPLGGADGLKDATARWAGAVFEANRVTGRFEVKHGASGVTHRDNLVRADDAIAFAVDGYSAPYERGVVDLTLERNTAINAGASGNFVQIAAGAQGVSLVDNLYVAPELVTGANGAAAIYVSEPDLRAFARIAGNCWPVAKPNRFAQNGVHHVPPAPGAAGSGYVAPAAWATMGPVSGDRFENLGARPGEMAAALAGDRLTANAGADATRWLIRRATTRPVDGGERQEMR